MSRYARKNLQDLFADQGTDKVTMALANFHDIDDESQKFDRAVVAFVDDVKELSYTGAVTLTGDIKEHCRTAWVDGKPLVTLSKGAEGTLPVLTADVVAPVADEVAPATDNVAPETPAA